MLNFHGNLRSPSTFFNYALHLQRDKNWKGATANSSNRRSLRDLGAKLKAYDDFIFDMEDY